MRRCDLGHVGRKGRRLASLQSGAGAVMITGVGRTPPDCFAGSKRGTGPAASRQRFTVAKPSPERRCADNNSARCAFNNTARKKSKDSESDRGLVSVFEKTKRISGVSWGHAGTHPKPDAPPDRRSHDRRGDLAVDANYGCRNQIHRHGESQRGESVADRPADRQRLQMPGSRARQSRLRGRGRNG